MTISENLRQLLVLGCVATLTACGGGSGDGKEQDDQPDPLAFEPAVRGNVAPGIEYLSPPLTISGISTGVTVPVTASGATLLVNGVAVEGGHADAGRGDEILLRIAAPGGFEQEKAATLTVADQELTYTLRTGKSKLAVSRKRNTKSLAFNWDALDVTHYRILHNPEGDSGFTAVLDVDGTVSSVELPVAVAQLNWERDRFAVEACLSTVRDGSNCSILPGHDIALEQAQSLEMIDLIKPIAVENEQTAGDFFGARLALSGNGEVLAVGALSDKGETDTDAGAVHIYRRGESGWEEEAVITEPDDSVDATFGEGFGDDAIALNHEGSMLAVTQSSGAVDGRTLIYRYDGKAWQRDGDPLVSSGITQTMSSVALTSSGDRLATGNRIIDIHDRDAEEGWRSVQALVAGVNGNTGGHIRISADGRVIAVGARFEDSRQGAVYMFFDSDGDGLYDGDEDGAVPVRISGDNSTAGDSFGVGLALNADGTLLVVGAEDEDAALDDPESNGSEALKDSGAVYVFRREGGVNNWSQIAYLKAPNAGESEYFGSAVALSADGRWLASCGYGETGVGTGVYGPGSTVMNDKDSARELGAIYLYERTGDTEWTFRRYIKAPVNTDPDDYLGFCDTQLAMSADGAVIAVEASYHDGAGTGVNSADPSDTSAEAAGAVFVY